jgi:hypothetical protein
VVDVPPAISASRGDRAAQSILQGTAFTFKRGINAGLGNGTDEIRSEDWAFLNAHNRCSIRQSVGNTPSTMARVTAPNYVKQGIEKSLKRGMARRTRRCTVDLR